jgi:hypothetical protein
MTDQHKRTKWVWTHVQSEWDEQRQRYVTKDGDGYWYDGPWALAHNVAAVFVAEDFQWFDDDAAIPNAKSLAAENTAITAAVGQQIRLRVNVAETNNADGTGLTTGGWTLQYQINSDGWNTLGAATDVRYFDSSNLSNGTAIATGNHVLTFSGSETATNEGDECEDGVSATHSGTGWSNEVTEIEFTVDFNTNLSLGDTVTFQVLDPNGAAVTFTNVPTAIIGIAVPVGSTTIAGLQPTIDVVENPIEQPAAASLTITPYAPQRAYGMVLGGQDVTIDVAAADGNITKTVPAGSLDVGLLAPTAPTDIVIAVAAESLTITTTTVQVYVNPVIVVAQDSVVITPLLPTTTTNFIRGPPVQSVQITGLAPSLQFKLVEGPSAGGLSLTGYEPSISYDKALSVGQASLTIAGQNVTVGFDFAKIPATDSLQISGLLAQLSYSVPVNNDSVVISGAAPSLSTGEIVLPTVGSLSLAQPESISLVGTVQTGSTVGGGDVTLTFDGSPAENDYVLVIGGHGDTVTTLDDPGSGYTQIYVNTGVAPIWGVWYKKLGATPDSSVVCSGGGNANDVAAYISYVLRGVHGQIFQDVARVLGSGAGSTPDPASITPQTVGSWVFAIASQAAYDPSITYPSGYTNTAQATNNGVADTNVGSCTKEWSSGAEDPGAYGSFSGGPWETVTLAVKANNYSPTLRFDYAQAPTADSLVISGQNVSLGGDKNIDVPQASLTISGQGVTLGFDWVTVPAADSLQISALAPSLRFDYVESPTADGLVIASNAPTLLLSPAISVANDALVITGHAPVIGGQNVEQPDADSLVISSAAPTLVFDWVVTSAADSVVITGLSPVLSYTVTSSADALQITGLSPSIDVAAGDKTEQVAAGSLSIATYAASLKFDYTFTSAADSLNITTYAPDIGGSKVVYPGNDSLSTSTYAPSLKLALVTTPAADSLAISSAAPSVEAEISLAVASDSLAITTLAPSLKGDYVATISADGLQITTYAPGLGGNTQKSPNVAAVNITGNAPTIGLNIAVAADNLQISTYAPSLKLDYLLSVGADSLQITGYAVIAGNQGINVDAASVTISGYAASVATDAGTPITNPWATTDVPVNYQIDDRTGFKIKVKHPMVREYTGHYVRPESLDKRSEQEFARSKRKERQKGPLRPEPVNNERFIEDEYPNGVDSEDL